MQKMIKLAGVAVLLFNGVCSGENTSLPLSDTPFGMPYYVGSVYPTPREAVYHDDFLPVENVAIMTGREVQPDDMLLQLLKQRILECGGKA